jgi:hypothetical protein
VNNIANAAEAVPHLTLYRVRAISSVVLRLAQHEPEENTNPDRYPEAFRLDPAEVNNFIVVPIIPPLRKSQIG